MPKNGLRRVRVGKALVHDISFADAVLEILALARTRAAGVVVTPNIQHIALLESDDGFGASYARADLVLPDGWPVVLAMRLSGRGATGWHRITGADLVPELCKAAAFSGLSVGFVGGAPTAASQALDRLRSVSPDLRCVFLEAPSRGFEHRPNVVDDLVLRISDAGPDILFLGLGTPKQECFADSTRDELNVGVTVCVGAAIDFIAGVQRRAPGLVQAVGLEWAYRMVHDPRRLVVRYLWAAPRFLVALVQNRR